MSQSSEFGSIRDGYLREGRLYSDASFQAIPRSVYYSKHNPYIRWRRPTEICQNPQFIVDGATRFDLDQGQIGNCWYIAGAATLATRKDLFTKVVPGDQGFGDNYAGIFHFHFWRFGRWVEVIIDDKLPTVAGKLIFCNNREEPTEFWSALLEKAYAKLHGSYEALDGGWTEDALVDFTGGYGQRLELKELRRHTPENLFTSLCQFHIKGTLMGCSIHATKDTMESHLDNGLVIGHAYSVTKLLKIMHRGQPEELIRLRNPWGATEWKGPWSDGSREWRSLTPEAREQMGIILEEDGEFWMSFRDWLHNFEQAQLCHLSPSNNTSMVAGSPSNTRVGGAPSNSKSTRDWTERVFHGSWTKGVSAGGCGNPPHQRLYWTNPQYCVTLTPRDPAIPRAKSWMVISLMQKDSRRLRSVVRSEDTQCSISFDLYKVKAEVPTLLEGESYSRYALELTKRGADYSYCREKTHTFYEEPGTYVIIPSTFQPHDQRHFVLRVSWEGDVDASEMDVETGPVEEPSHQQKDFIVRLFNKYAGKDEVIDARELRALLNEAFTNELGSSHQFELEACRSLLCMMDSDKSGYLEYEEVRKMWVELMTWQNTFHKFDQDRSGFISVGELKSVFKSVGYNISRLALEALVRRYGGRDEKLSFDDFVIAMSKVISIMDVFSGAAVDRKAILDLEKFMQLSLSF